ncbi:MAG: alpha/beta hydrolase [Bacilli bacterium]|nr:alpha/beta hydrolase [Bacilli bacterium]
MLYIVILLLLIVILCFIISGCMFIKALSRGSDKSSVLESDLNGRKTDMKIKISLPDTKWLNDNCKKVNIKSKDNLKLQGYIVNNNSDKWIIFVHGYSGDHKHMINRAKKMYEMGYQVLLVDLRGHGKSEGKYITMGIKDCYDIKEWITYLIENESAKEIGLFGISMGAATVMMTIGLDLPKEVKFAIEDCGYTSVWEEFKYQVNNLYHLPTFPFLHICNLFAIIFAKYNFKSYSPIEAISNTKIPLLLIHGSNDTFVPFKMLNENYNACSSKKQQLIVNGANHAESQDLDYNKYWETIEKFIK